MYTFDSPLHRCKKKREEFLLLLHLSEGFAKFLNTFSEKGISQISFVVGGSEGFPKQLISKAKKILAVSKMVFPHKIARLILVEQLYRAKCIINRHPYHKA